MKEQNQDWQKKSYQKVGYELKLFIIDQIQNGQISINYASKKYEISRSSITYWMNKHSNFTQNNTAMSKNDQIKKLKEKVEELEFVKDFQQDIIADLENITGLDLAKKSLPETLVKEIEQKKKNLSK
ncbi:MAG: DNA-binding protein [Candidatus Peregrinibacteria bacterium]|nr:DNA-binding protein [Candidatus Peregrinibacteria bacterium]